MLIRSLVIGCFLCAGSMATFADPVIPSSSERLSRNWVCKAKVGFLPRRECKAYGYTRTDAERNFRNICGWTAGLMDPSCRQL